jgi:hypothetical protein
MTIRNHGLTALAGLAVLATVVYASTGDRNPNFQQCLKGCRITYCDPSQPPIPAYLRAFGWTCEDNCRYECGHAFTDMIRTGSRYHQCEPRSLRLSLLVHELILQSMANGRSTAWDLSRNLSQYSCPSETFGRIGRGSRRSDGESAGTIR